MIDRPQSGTARAEFWIALAVAGQAAALALIEAGPIVRYQHYAPISELLRTPRIWLVVCLLMQVGLVLGPARSLLRSARGTVTGWLSPMRWALLAATVVLTSATLSRDPTVYVIELVVASTVALTQIANVIVAAGTLSSRQLGVVGSWWERVVGDGEGRDRFALWCAAVVFVTCVVLVYTVYQAHPHVPDEVAYLLHGRYLAAGRLDMPLPSVPSAFSVDIMMFEPDRWYSPVPPGWPMVLSIGFLLGNPWLVNPVLAGINVLLAHFVVENLYDRPTARLATLFLVVSPWHLFMAMNVMPHTLTLTCALAAAAAVIRLRATGRWWWALPGGAAIGWTSMIRPLEGLAIAGLLGLWTLTTKPLRRGVSFVLTLGVSTGMVSALQLVYNRIMTGSAGTFPIMAYTEAQFGRFGVSNALGFGPDRGLGWTGLDPLPGHGILDVMINTNLNLFAANIEMLGWLGGSLTLVMIAVVATRRWGTDAMLIAWIATVMVVHAFYWFAGGPDFGARYWYLILVPGLVLVARGLQMVAAELNGQYPGSRGWHRALAVAGIIALVSVTTFLPWRSLDKYRGYRGMQPGIARLVPQLGNGLVFVNAHRHPDYHSVVLQNPIVLRDDRPVFVRAPNLAVADSVVDAYPNRPIWIVDGPSVIDRGFEVRAGPLTPDAFRRWGTRLLVYDPPPETPRPQG